MLFSRDANDDDAVAYDAADWQSLVESRVLFLVPFLQCWRPSAALVSQHHAGNQQAARPAWAYRPTCVANKHAVMEPLHVSVYAHVKPAARQHSSCSRHL